MMTATQQPVSVGVFDNLDQAERTIDHLRQHGFAADEIGIVGHVGEEQSVSAPMTMKAPERNAMHGAWTGGLFGGIIGLLVMMVIPGLGAAAQAGWWFETLGGVVFGAAAGGALFAFGSLWFVRDRSRLYKTELEQGRFIVTVNNPDRQHEALAVLGHEAVHSETAAT